MYGIALSVAACLRGGTRVDLAWNLDPDLTPRFDPADAVGITPGGGRLGTLLGGAVDSRIVELASARPTSGRITEIELNAIEAEVVGVEAGTMIRVLMAPADTLPPELWGELRLRQPISVVAKLAGATITAARMALNDASESSVTLESDSVTTAWSPRPILVVMGSGQMAAALADAGSFVGWNVERSPGPEAAIGVAATLSGIDGVVVVGHDIEATGRVLQAAAGSEVGYIGSIGPPAIQAARLDWIRYRGVTDTERISAPAGIDIGARTPSEVAISVIAEMIACQSQSSA